MLLYIDSFCVLCVNKTYIVQLWAYCSFPKVKCVHDRSALAVHENKR